jgi:hypothetical protein
VNFEPGQDRADELADDNGAALARSILSGPAITSLREADVTCTSREDALCALHGPSCPQRGTGRQGAEDTPEMRAECLTTREGFLCPLHGPRCPQRTGDTDD